MKNTSDAPKAGGTKPIPGAHTDPSSIPQPSHGGDNSRDAPHTEGKDGNGAQKRQQQHKS